MASGRLRTFTQLPAILVPRRPGGNRGSQVRCRFSYCALLTLAILDRTAAISTSRAVAHLVACRNFDGGFGCNPGARSPPPAPIALTTIPRI